MKEHLKVFGGFLVVMIFPLLICWAWDIHPIMPKLVLTDVILIASVWVIEGSTKD